MSDWLRHPFGWSPAVAPLTAEQRTEVIRVVSGVEANARHGYAVHLRSERDHARGQARDYPKRAAEFGAVVEAYERALELLRVCWPEYAPILADPGLLSVEVQR